MKAYVGGECTLDVKAYVGGECNGILVVDC